MINYAIVIRTSGSLSRLREGLRVDRTAFDYSVLGLVTAQPGNVLTQPRPDLVKLGVRVELFIRSDDNP
jgi:hypothetical protein